MKNRVHIAVAVGGCVLGFAEMLNDGSGEKARGFGPVSMNSFNHYAYGAVAGWMFSAMAGVRDDPAAPGFRHFVLAPVPEPRIGKVDASFRSPLWPGPRMLRVEPRPVRIPYSASEPIPSDV